MLEVIDKGSGSEAHPVLLLFVHGGWHSAECAASGRVGRGGHRPHQWGVASRVVAAGQQDLCG
jgi:hypothetical protein